MSSIKVKPYNQGLNEFRNSEEIQDYLLEKADEIAGKVEGNFNTDVYTGKTRANASIAPADDATFYRTMKTNDLLKALR